MHIENEFTGNSSWDSSRFEGSAHFFLLSEDHERFIALDDQLKMLSSAARAIVSSSRINLDLVITQVGYQSADANQLDPHNGETFSHHFFGYSPTVLKVSGFLADTTHSIGKAELMGLYRWLFRVGRVAKTGIAPVLSFVGGLAQGAMLDLGVSERAEMEDFLTVQFSFLALKIRYNNPDNAGANTVEIDFSTPADAWVLNKALAEANPSAPQPDPDISQIIYTAPTIA